MIDGLPRLLAGASCDGARLCETKLGLTERRAGRSRILADRRRSTCVCTRHPAQILRANNEEKGYTTVLCLPHPPISQLQLDQFPFVDASSLSPCLATRHRLFQPRWDMQLAAGASANTHASSSIPAINGRADILGFANSGVVISRASKNNTPYLAPAVVCEGFDHENGGWRVDKHPHFMADTTGTAFSTLSASVTEA
jgi:hypothetical protein